MPAADSSLASQSVAAEAWAVGTGHWTRTGLVDPQQEERRVMVAAAGSAARSGGPWLVGRMPAIVASADAGLCWRGVV